VILASVVACTCKQPGSALAGPSTSTAVSSSTRSNGKLASSSVVAAAKKPVVVAKPAFVIPEALKLVIGAGGIYAAFLYYGSLQEDVFHYKSKTGVAFKQVWFLQLLEALANVVVGGFGLYLSGGSTKGVPHQMFTLSGTAQVFAKAFNSLALSSGVSFPVVTLAKSGKMVPVMIGSILLGGKKYTLREYAAVGAIIAGTVLVSSGGKAKAGEASSLLGIAYIALSLGMDGITGGMQSRIKEKAKSLSIKLKPYDFMFWTNLFMSVIAAGIALVRGELHTGIDFCLKNPVIMEKIIKFAICSAVGQSFIFYTIANFDPLVCTTVTTTRKVFSVLLSIFTKGHPMSTQGWAGIGLASLGILSELQDKSSGGGHHGAAKKSEVKGAKVAQAVVKKVEAKKTAKK